MPLKQKYQTKQLEINKTKQIFKVSMQISLPILTVNYYLVVYVNTIACY